MADINQQFEPVSEEQSSIKPSNTSTLSTITSDEEFMDEMIKIKKILKIDDIDELKAEQSELLRNKIMNVLKYVMTKIDEEEAPEEQSGGKMKSKKSNKSQKQKGGTPMDLNRITNTKDLLKDTKGPYEQIIDSPDLHIALNMHKAFTAGNISGFSSVVGLPASDLNTVLPSLGTGQSGGAYKKSKQRK